MPSPCEAGRRHANTPYSYILPSYLLSWDRQLGQDGGGVQLTIAYVGGGPVRLPAQEKVEEAGACPSSCRCCSSLPPPTSHLLRSL